MRFKQFLLSEQGQAPTETDPSEVLAWCEQHCSKYLQRAAEFPIYRGMNLPNDINTSIYNTNSFTRKSANTYNYYTLLFDNHPSWKDYPKRSKSMICTTEYSTADGYGNVFIVIPSDKAKIGVCPANDLWNSFDHFLNNFSDDAGDMDEFNVIIHLLAKRGLNKDLGDDITYGELVSVMKKMTAEVALMIADKYKDEGGFDAQFNRRRFSALANNFERHGFSSAFDAFEKEGGPSKNAFALRTGATFDVEGNHEVWIQGEIALISHDDLYNNKIPELADFAKKYLKV